MDRNDPARLVVIEYFYSAHSAFAYLGSETFMRIAKAAGRTIVHKPMDLRRVVAAAKGADFDGYGPEHMAYFFGREIERWSEYRGAPVMGHRPTHHDNEIESSNCVLIAAMEQGASIDRLAHVLLEAHWRDDADLADAETLRNLTETAGLDADEVLAAASTPPVRAIYEANTNEAIARSVFGAPTYFVDGDMFYGQDHLEMMERALRKPFV